MVISYSTGQVSLILGDGTKLDPGHRDTLIFDPPWDAEINIPGWWVSEFRHVLAFCDGFRARDVIEVFGPPTWVFTWDCCSSWWTPNRPLRRQKMCLWYGPITDYREDGAFYGESSAPRMVKNTRGEYMHKPDERGKRLSDVFKQPITGMKDKTHPHEKPAAWVRMLIANCTVGQVFDPFCGSGAIMEAAHAVGRVVLGSEIDPETAERAFARLASAEEFVQLNPRKQLEIEWDSQSS